MKKLQSFLNAYLIIFLIFLIAYSQNAVRRTITGREIKKGFFKGKNIEYVDRLIGVKIKEGFPKQEMLNVFNSSNYKLIEDFDKLGWTTIEIPKGADVFKEMEKLSRISNILAVEPVMVDHIALEPDDPYFKGTNPATYPHQWALKNYKNIPPWGRVDADIDAVQAWDITTGSSDVIIAILDSGIPMQNNSLSHPDLSDPNKIILGPDYIDIPADGVKDVLGHGTHVAGIAGAETDNSAGIAGIAWGSKLLIIQVFDGSGYGTDNAFKSGVIYAVDYYLNHPGTKMVINYSGGGPASQKIEDAVNYANTYGVPIIAAAGNESDSVKYPAAYTTSYSNVIAVSATDHYDSLASYSNFGSEITVAAPGGYGGDENADDIFSTTPNYSFVLEGSGTPQNYGYMGGTSMAAPHVSGLAALVFSVNPNYTASQLRDLIENNADDLGAPGFDNLYGYGRINALRTVAKAFVAANPSYTYTEGTLPLTLFKSDFGTTFLNDPLPDLASGWYSCDIYVAQITVNKQYVSQPQGWYIGMEGYSAENPNDASLWVDVNVGTSSSSFKTFFYYIKYDLNGQQINRWAPVDPNLPEGIKYALLGIPQPLSVTITGPTYLQSGQTGTFTANPSGGSGTYVDYRWWERNDDDTPLSLSSQYIQPNAPAPGDWIEITSARGQQTIQRGHPWNFSLKCEVTDSDGNTATDIHSVTVGGQPSVVSKIEESENLRAVPDKLILYDNYPNPFNPVTTIRFGLPEDSKVTLTIYSPTGEQVTTLVNKHLPAGYHQVQWDGTNAAGISVASGIYIYEMKTGQQRLVKKMLLAK